MKLWQAILFTIAIFVIINIFSPAEIFSAVYSLVALISAIWVYINAKKIQIRKYQSSLPTTEFAIAALVFIVWPISFPAYLGLNWRIKNNKQPIKKVKGDTVSKD